MSVKPCIASKPPGCSSASNSRHFSHGEADRDVPDVHQSHGTEHLLRWLRVLLPAVSGTDLRYLAGPAGRDNRGAITDKVARGKQVWEHNNCIGCHTLLGEGAYFAPELGNVYKRFGSKEAIIAWIKAQPTGAPGAARCRSSTCRTGISTPSPSS